MRVNTHYIQLFLFLIFIFCEGCRDRSPEGRNSGSPEGENWRLSKILTEDSLYAYFKDSLKSVRMQGGFEQADSVLQQVLLIEGPGIPNSVLNEILYHYKNDFAFSKPSQAFAHEELAVSYLRLSKFDSVKNYSASARELYREISNKEAEARTEMIEAAALSFEGDFLNAQQHQFKALDIYKELGDSAGIYATLAEFSINNFNEKRFNKSIEVAEKVLAYARSSKDSFLLGDMLNTLGSAYHQTGNDSMANIYVLESIELRKNLKDDFGLSQAYGGMAMNEMAKGDWKEALVWCGRAVEISLELQDYRNLAGLYYNIGTCYMELNQPDRAEAAFNKVIEFSDETGLKDQALNRTLGRLAEILTIQKRTAEANAVLVRLVKLKDDIFSTEKLKITEELTAKYENAEKEAFIKQIEQENKRVKEKRFIVTLSLSLVSLLLLGLLIVLLQRNKSIKRLMIAKQKLKEEEFKLIQRELQYNREQLNDFTHHLVEKNKIIFELEKKLLSGLKVNTNEQVVGEADSSEMSNLLQLRILTEDDWTKFKIYFDKVFPGMIITLRQKHPDLTPAEERLFLLMKLKSDSREMSEILGISMESVRKNKYRLKKKLQIIDDRPLEDYIDKF
jgi:tetratricopeptide (TPR) repeat protein/DNA-binding CsgD family transcriptional regulator